MSVPMIIQTSVPVSAEVFGHSSTVNPAAVYISSLRSKLSRRSMTSNLSRAWSLITNGYSADFSWELMRKHHVSFLVSLLSDIGFSPATVNAYLSGLKGVAREALDLNLISAEEFFSIKSVQGVSGQRVPKGRVLDQSEVRSLLNVCASDKRVMARRDEVILLLLVECGLRRSEVVGLRREHFDMSSQAVRVLGKGNKERMTYLARPSTFQLVKAYIENTSDDLLFTGYYKSGRPRTSALTAQSVYDIVKARALEAGIESLTPHDLRRTFATTLLEQTDTSLTTIRELLGHASVTTTQRYIRVGEQVKRDALNALPNW